MGKVIILLFVLATIYLLWRAFGPSSTASRRPQQPPAIKGPDDDPDFLWELKKREFKKRRREERGEE